MKSMNSNHRDNTNPFYALKFIYAYAFVKKREENSTRNFFKCRLINILLPNRINNHPGRIGAESTNSFSLFLS